MESKKVILETDIPGKKLYRRGKVRDTYRIPGWPRTDNEELLLMITTDRSSAFDIVMSRGIPELGKIRNQISLFWFELLKDICPNHIFSADQQLCARTVKKQYREPNDLIGRSVLVYPAAVFPVECVVRGFLDGSAWESYKETGEVCGIKLQPELKRAEELPQPIFTPATKARTGHDENITFDGMAELVGGGIAEKLRDLSLRLYIEADRWARTRGIIIADTKFEFGLRPGQIVIADELLTPDSSRFWEAVLHKPGRPQPSFDKQPLRDWLKDSGWDKKPPPPDLPDEVIDKMRERYATAYERLVGKTWPPDF
jgi:phosphoribosylaminoimidazole-succinocarboxamide synthase